MFRIDVPTAATTLPTPAAAGTEGFFTQGNPASNIPATVLSQDWANTVQEEICAVIAAAGLARSKTNNAQLLAALNALFAGGTGGRTKLGANVGYFVSSTGLDTNDGSSAHPWLTLQHAYNVIDSTLDLNGFVVTINVAAGTYTAGLIAAGDLVGNTRGPGGLVFLGVPGAPSTCIVNVTNSTCFYGTYGAKFTVSGFHLAATGTHPNGDGILAQFGGTSVLHDHIEFGVCTSAHSEGTEFGESRATTTISMVGGGGNHLLGSLGGMAYEAISETVTISGAITFTNAFAATTVDGIVEARANTYSGGTVTGIPYIANTGVIDTNGGGPTYFPGGGGSSTPNGGQYL